jgi:hypothetical protein
MYRAVAARLVCPANADRMIVREYRRSHRQKSEARLPRETSSRARDYVSSPSTSDTIIPRLLAAGADRKRCNGVARRASRVAASQSQSHDVFSVLFEGWRTLLRRVSRVTAASVPLQSYRASSELPLACCIPHSGREGGQRLRNVTRDSQNASARKLPNPRPVKIMSQPSPLSVLSGAWKIADKATVALEAVGNKIRVNSQGWEDARIATERQCFMVVAIKGKLYMMPEARPAKFEQIDQTGLREGGLWA